MAGAARLERRALVDLGEPRNIRIGGLQSLLECVRDLERMTENNSRQRSSDEAPTEPHVGEFALLRFTVDAALLQELGQRLVGKPFTALAELVKNSYDADAENVVIRFGDDELEVSDDDHGMDFESFVSRWMRVGSTHKSALERSPEKERPLTGSKGVGRLAAQFLSSGLKVISTPKADLTRHLEVDVDWKDIPNAKDLKDVTATLRMVAGSSEYPNDSEHGTRIIMRGLRHQWTAEELRELAKELWFLQPPDEIGGDFKVDVESADWTLTEEFDSQMRAILDVWNARLTGEVIGVGADRRVRVLLSFRDGQVAQAEYRDAYDYTGKLQFKIEDVPNVLRFDIRIYNLQYRQPEGIGVKEARSYMNEYGGVHIYDSGFRLPHYGPDVDWLEIEMDHSHRLSRSRLLPAGRLETVPQWQGLLVLGRWARALSGSDGGFSSYTHCVMLLLSLVLSLVQSQRSLHWHMEFDGLHLGKRRANFGKLPESLAADDPWAFYGNMGDGRATTVLFPVGSSEIRIYASLIDPPDKSEKPVNVGWLALETNYRGKVRKGWYLPVWWYPTNMRFNGESTRKFGTLQLWLSSDGYEVRGPFTRTERAWLSLRAGFAKYDDGAYAMPPGYGYVASNGVQVEEQQDKTQPGNWFRGPFPISNAERADLLKMRSQKR